MSYKKQLIEKANEIGTHFCVNFPVKDGVAIGNIFYAYNKVAWQVCRIDNVVVNGDELIVEGLALPKPLVIN